MSYFGGFLFHRRSGHRMERAGQTTLPQTLTEEICRSAVASICRQRQVSRALPLPKSPYMRHLPVYQPSAATDNDADDICI